MDGYVGSYCDPVPIKAGVQDGIVSDRRKNKGFKAPKKSEKYQNLYFVGGSVNPGGGMPMAVLSGQRVVEMIVKKHE